MTITLCTFFVQLCIIGIVCGQDCKTSEKGKEYGGHIATAKGGRRCQAWAERTPVKHSFWNKDSKFPNDGSVQAASNYCRNPDNSKYPWCYTVEGGRWEYCDIPLCPQTTTTGACTCEEEILELRGSMSQYVDREAARSAEAVMELQDQVTTVTNLLLEKIVIIDDLVEQLNALEDEVNETVESFKESLEPDMRKGKGDGEGNAEYSRTNKCHLESYLTHLKDSAFDSSSKYNDNTGPFLSRLYTTSALEYYGGWMAKSVNVFQWIEADLGSARRVVAVATQGLDNTAYWVSSYVIRYSNDRHEWTELQDRGEYFAGNVNYDGVVVNYFDRPFTARYVRLLPKTWQSRIALRWQLYGDECENCTGIAYIAHSQGVGLSASSEYNHDYGSVNNSILHHASSTKRYGAWMAQTNNNLQWIQMDLGGIAEIASIATQGRQETSYWVKQYRLKYSNDLHVWTRYNNGELLNGNYDRNTVVRRNLVPFTARYVRLLPVRWQSHISLRWELYSSTGCEVATCSTPGVPMSSLIAGLDDDQLSTSSDANSYHDKRNLRLHTVAGSGRTGSWSSAANNRHQWIKVDIGNPKQIVAVATQGRQESAQWVMSYTIEFSNDDQSWTRYAEQGTIRIFGGNMDRNGVVTNILSSPFTARYVRLHPLHIYGHTSMRWELYSPECQACAEPALIEGLKDYKLTASTSNSDSLGPHRSHLYSTDDYDSDGCWYPSTLNTEQWIQADFGTKVTIQTVATQGRDLSNQWVTSYSLQYSNDGNTWTDYQQDGYTHVFNGNNDRATVVRNVLARPIKARYIRLRPLSWYSRIALRWEVYAPSGCEVRGCNDILRDRTSYLHNVTLSSSSQYNTYHGVDNSYLHKTKQGSYVGAWVSKNNRVGEWIQAAFSSLKQITSVATQGREDSTQYLYSYFLKYSSDGSSWTPYTENGVMRLFRGNKDRNTVQVNDLSEPFQAKMIRLYPMVYSSRMSLRWELYGSGCNACSPAHYIQAAEDSQLSASGEYNVNMAVTRSRLYTTESGSLEGSWRARSANKNQWLQVDLGKSRQIYGVATQGREDYNRYVRSYTVKYSDDGSNWTTFTPEGGSRFIGNADQNTVVTHMWPESPFSARYVRLEPYDWYGDISMRWEVFGSTSASCSA